MLQADDELFDPNSVPPVRRRQRVGSSVGGRDPWWIGALVVLGVSILAHGARALAMDWLPGGDDAFWAIMSRSVFSGHPPLLGSSSSGGVVSGSGYHHLGPIGFYLLAPFVLVFSGAGVAVGSAVLNATWAVIAPVAVRAAVGARAGWMVLIGSALLAFTMGSELLVDPWNPHLATLPMWCGLACAWAVIVGRPMWSVPAMAALCLAFQTHLSFAPVAGAAGLVVLVATTYWCAKRARTSSEGGSVMRAWAPLGWATLTTLVMSSVMLIQQFFGAGPGNLTQALGSTQQDAPVGPLVGVRIVAQPLLDVTNWFPGRWTPTVIAEDDWAPWWVLALVVAVGTTLLVFAVRQRRATAVASIAFSLALLGIGVELGSRVPFRFDEVPTALVRWAWPIALFVQIVLLDAAVGLLAATDRSRRPEPAVPSWVRACCFGVVALLVAANVPWRDEGSGASPMFRSATAEVLDLASGELRAIERPLVEVRLPMLAHSTAGTLIDWMDDRGIPFAVDDPVILRQVGGQHAPTGTETATVRVEAGPAALEEAPPGFERIARTNPLDRVTTNWFFSTRDRLEQRLAPFVDRAMDDAELRERSEIERSRLEEFVPLAPGGWYFLLCAGEPVIEAPSAEFEREVIARSDLVRLCEVADELYERAVAIDVGPPPA